MTPEKAASPTEESTEEAPHDETPCRESSSHAEEEEEADVYVDLERLSVAEAAVARSPAPSLNLRADSSSDAGAPSSPSSPHGESVVATLNQLNRSLDRAGEVRRGLEVRCDATEDAFRAAMDERDAVRMEIEDVAALNATLRRQRHREALQTAQRLIVSSSAFNAARGGGALRSVAPLSHPSLLGRSP